MAPSVRRVITIALVLLLTCIGALFSRTPRSSAFLLDSSWETTAGGIGIPGLSKTYEAVLTNRSLLPISIDVCDYVTDTSSHGKSVAYSAERWDQHSQEWRFSWGESPQAFCQPYPLGITSASKIRSTWLWPGESISTDFVAIQAIDGLNLGDRMRFTITPFLKHPDVAVSTPPFTVDELPADPNVDFRIRH